MYNGTGGEFPQCLKRGHGDQGVLQSVRKHIVGQFNQSLFEFVLSLY